VSPFDSLAPTYAQDWSQSPKGRAQREEVWRQIDALFEPGMQVLDFGCGIGDDAVHLESRQVRVTGVDPSGGMGAHAHIKVLEEIPDTIFDGVLSNFGALNCVEDLEQQAELLARHLRPDGFAAICIMGRFAWNDLRHAWQRLTGRSTWRGIAIRYWSSGQMRFAFRHGFTFLKRVPIGGGDHQLYIFQRTSRRSGS